MPSDCSRRAMRIDRQLLTTSVAAFAGGLAALASPLSDAAADVMAVTGLSIDVGLTTAGAGLAIDFDTLLYDAAHTSLEDHAAAPYELLVTKTASGYGGVFFSTGSEAEVGWLLLFQVDPASLGATLLPFAAGETIDGSGVLSTEDSFLWPTESAGWSDGVPAYAGFALTKGAYTYYGWVGLTPISLGAVIYPSTFTVTGFAIETTAGTPIAAGAVPEPGSTSLALIALGAAGVTSWRRRRVERVDG